MTESEPQSPEKKLPPQGETFESLFPEVSYDKLPKVLPKTPFHILGRLEQSDRPEQELADAARAKKGHAYRVSMPPDRLGVWFELQYSIGSNQLLGLDVVLGEEDNTRHKGWIRDMIKPDEEIGGVVRRMTYVATPERRSPAAVIKDLATAFGPVENITGVHEAIIAEPVYTVGIYDKNQKPTALIHYTPGPELLRKKEPVQKKNFLTIPQTN